MIRPPLCSLYRSQTGKGPCIPRDGIEKGMARKASRSPPAGLRGLSRADTGGRGSQAILEHPRASCGCMCRAPRLRLHFRMQKGRRFVVHRELHFVKRGELHFTMHFRRQAEMHRMHLCAPLQRMHCKPLRGLRVLPASVMHLVVRWGHLSMLHSMHHWEMHLPPALQDGSALSGGREGRDFMPPVKWQGTRTAGMHGPCHFTGIVPPMALPSLAYEGVVQGRLCRRSTLCITKSIGLCLSKGISRRLSMSTTLACTW